MKKNRKLKITYNAPVVLSFVILSFIALVLNEKTGGYTNARYFCTYASSLISPLTYLRMFTHVLGHSGLQHFAGNMAYILMLGPIIEEKYGSFKTFLVIITTALSTAILHSIFFPAAALLGASGVCFAFMLLASVAGAKEGEIPLSFVLAAVFFLGQQLAEGILIKDNVSNMSHIAGGLAGSAFGFLGRKKRGSLSYSAESSYYSSQSNGTLSSRTGKLLKAAFAIVAAGTLAFGAWLYFSGIGPHLWLSSVPDYSGTPYYEINDNKPFFTEEDLKKAVFEEYSELDSLGCCGPAFAMLGTELMPEGERGSIQDIYPTGWHNRKYSFIEGAYLYNRCHLIAYMLAGEDANERNLITGTRYMNVEGMLPFEKRVCKYIELSDNHVLYRVTPIFKGKNLLASGVLMEGLSVEDGGENICFNVFVYNVQPGVEINYRDGR